MTQAAMRTTMKNACSNEQDLEPYILIYKGLLAHSILFKNS
jgi:hypothetical protein